MLIKRHVPPLIKERYRDIFTFPVKDYYALAGLDFNLYSFEELGKEWMDEYQNRRFEVSLYPRAKEILTKIHNQGIEQSILSAYKQDTLLELISHFNLNHFFTHLIGLDHIYATSKLELGKNLMTRINHQYSSVLLIGDTVHDFEVAQAMNAGGILIADGHQCKEKLSVCGVEVFENLDQVMEQAIIRDNLFTI